MATLPISFPAGGGGSDEVTATKAQVLAPYTAITSDSDDEPVEGTIPSMAAATYYATLEEQTIIPAGKYAAGAQTISHVGTSGFLTADIKKGVTVKLNNGNETIRQGLGTYTGVLSSGQTAVDASKILTGYSAYVNGGGEIKGSISSKGATTFGATTSDQSIAAGQYLSGAQTIKGVKMVNITEANIKAGITVKVGDADSATRLANVGGTYTSALSSGQTAMTAGQLLSGYSGFVNGSAEIKGTLADKAGSSSAWKNYTATLTDDTTNSRIVMQVPAAGYYNEYSHLYAGTFSDYGTAENGNVLSGYTYTGKGGFKQTGTLTNKGGSSSSDLKKYEAAVDADTTNKRVRMKIPANGYYNAYAYLYAPYSEFGDNQYASNVLSGKTFTSAAGFKVTGTMANKSNTAQSATVTNDTTNSRVRMQVPAAGYYDTTSYLYASYSTFGDNGYASNVVDGKTFTSALGFKQSGTMANKSNTSQAATVSDNSTSSRVQMVIPAAGYYETNSYLYASYDTFGTAETGSVLKDKTFTGKGGFKVKGTIESVGGGTWYATTSEQTAVAAGKYTTGAHVVKALSNTNLATANILRGKTIKINNGSADVWSVSGSNDVLRVVTGTATTGTSTETITIESPSASVTMYYVSVNPGITPLYAACANNDGMVIRTGAKTGHIDMPGTNKAGYTSKFTSSFTSSNVRLYSNAKSQSISYWIFGY